MRRFFPWLALVFWVVACLFPIPDLPAADDWIPVTCFDPANVSRGVPGGWKLLRDAGTPTVHLEREGERVLLMMSSDSRSAFGIERELRVNLEEYPFLSWRWKATKLPRGGDIRRTETNDQALQIYVAFPPLGIPHQLRTPIVGYVWDTEAPRGLMTRNPRPYLPYIRYVVIRNKTDALGTWYPEKRNLLEDYRQLFPDLQDGKPSGKTVGMRLYINSQNTKSNAESYLADLIFSRL